METELVVVDVVNSIGPASMPFNEFAAYRARKYPHEKHVILSLEAVDAGFLRTAAAQVPGGNVTIVDCRGSVLRLAQATRELFRELRSKHPRVVVHLHHQRSGFFFHLIRPLLGGDTPVLFTVRNSFEDYSLPGKLLAGSNFLLARAVTFVGGASCRAFPATLRRLRGGAAHTVPNGADLERIDAALHGLAAEPPSAPAAPGAGADGAGSGSGLRLLYVARFVQQKNHRFLIDLLAQLPAGVTLTLVGEGVLRPQVSRWVGDAGLGDRVRFTGLIPREAVYDEMRRADVFVSTSRWEGLPVAVLEAMAARLPLVASDIEPHQEIAALAPSLKLLPFRLETWRDLLREWVSLPKQELRRIGERNREAVAAELSLARMHERYTEIYRRIAG
jgi:glycosyltransferase involved in cell wall biosynthesis